MNTQKIRVLIVDDSVVFRNFLRKCLTDLGDIEVVGIARDGVDALEKIKSLKPEVVTLDMEMPRMTGMEVLAELGGRDDNVEVVVVSGANRNDAERTVKALEAGAFDFVVKPTSDDPDPAATLKKVLNEKIALAARKVRLAGRRRGAPPPAAPPRRAPTRIEEQRRKMAEQRKQAAAAAAPPGVVPGKLRPRTLKGRPDIIAIGSSTGGPKALHAFFSELPGNLPVPLVLTQHMPKLFLVSLAKRINDTCPPDCVIAEEGMVLRPGVIHVAPGDRHMEIVRSRGGLAVHLDDGPKVHHCKPAVDPMFFSLARLAPQIKTLAVVLTGMGADGAAGAMEIGNRGGHVIVQDEKTSVVWGMPGATFKMGAAHEVHPLDLIDEAVLRFFNGGG
ncbi:MAG: chemotaxis-specific protein-glutamate methyltransferase CheB [Zetaproteobacteria bacterium]|nr:MAG: chemotaxis-specific protein-glutamate methyltransferase CheB [Zetaproteobacteria bacterium]